MGVGWRRVPAALGPAVGSRLFLSSLIENSVRKSQRTGGGEDGERRAHSLTAGHVDLGFLALDN